MKQAMFTCFLARNNPRNINFHLHIYNNGSLLVAKVPYRLKYKKEILRDIDRAKPNLLFSPS